MFAASDIGWHPADQVREAAEAWTGQQDEMKERSVHELRRKQLPQCRKQEAKPDEPPGGERDGRRIHQRES